MKLLLLILFFTFNVFGTLCPTNGRYSVWSPIDAFIRENIPNSQLKSLLQNAELKKVTEDGQEVNFIYETDDDKTVSVDFNINENGQVEDIDGEIIDDEEPESIFSEVEQQMEEMVKECKQKEQKLINSIAAEIRQLVAEAKRRSEEARKLVDQQVTVVGGPNESPEEQELSSVIKDEEGNILEKVYTPKEGISVYIENSIEQSSTIVVVVNTVLNEVLAVKETSLQTMEVEDEQTGEIEEREVIVVVSYQKERVNQNEGVIRKTTVVKSGDGVVIDESVQEEIMAIN